jgi:hypothetical protein
MLHARAYAENEGLYPGITQCQHEYAQAVMHEFFAQHWDQAESLCVDMRHLELDSSLLPMSTMLRFIMRGTRILNDEYESRQDCVFAMESLEPLRKECLLELHKKKFADSTRSTRLFLEGGVNGFNAALKTRTHPFDALREGVKAVRLLDTARMLTPNLYDAYLGLGLFQCALANEPGIVRVALSLFNGLKVNLDSGLADLRICEKQSLYTREGAMQYLIQFLSPLKVNEIEEKNAVFKLLQGLYPHNPYYVFQEIDEDMAFHRRAVFSGIPSTWTKSRDDYFDTCNFSLRRYAKLIQWQYANVNNDAVDTSQLSVAERYYSFYPLFLKAAKERYSLDSKKDLSAKQRENTIGQYIKLRQQAISTIKKSGINAMLLEYYLWHIEDGLK